MSQPIFFDNVGTYTLAHPQTYRTERLPTWSDHQTLGGAVWRDFASLQIVWLIQMGWEILTVSEFQSVQSVWDSMALGNSMTFTDLEGVTHTVTLDQSTLRFSFSPYTGSLGGAFQTLYMASLVFRVVSSATYSVP